MAGKTWREARVSLAPVGRIVREVAMEFGIEKKRGYDYQIERAGTSARPGVCQYDVQRLAVELQTGWLWSDEAHEALLERLKEYTVDAHTKAGTTLMTEAPQPESETDVIREVIDPTFSDALDRVENAVTVSLNKYVVARCQELDLPPEYMIALMSGVPRVVREAIDAGILEAVTEGIIADEF